MHRTLAIAFVFVSAILLAWTVFILVDLASKTAVLVAAEEWMTIGGRVLFAAVLATLSFVALRAGRLRW